MKRLAFLLSILAASSAQAQTRQPAQVTTLPSSTPQEFDLLNAAGAWVPLGVSANQQFSLVMPQSWTDIGRTGNDNTPTINLSGSESLSYTPSYVTHYGIYADFHETTGGTGDRIGAAFHQTCDATLANKSCVATSGVGVAGGAGLGVYVGSNPRALALTGFANVGGVVGEESDVESLSPVGLRYGMLISTPINSTGTHYQGSLSDAALMITSQCISAPFACGSVDGFKRGIVFGQDAESYPNHWPILPGGSLIEASSTANLVAWGINFTGMTNGFSNAAIGLPKGGALQWGATAQGGMFNSSATATGGKIIFTDNGTNFDNNASTVLLNIGGSDGVHTTAYAKIFPNADNAVALGDVTVRWSTVQGVAVSAQRLFGNGGKPTVSGCGTGASLSSSATDLHGTISEGSSASGCVVTFVNAFNSPPDCVVSGPSGTAFASYATSAGAAGAAKLTIVNSAVGSPVYTYICMGL